MCRINKNYFIYFFLLVVCFLIQCSFFPGGKALPNNQIIIDYSMPLKVQEWLKLLELDNDYLDVKNFFLDKVINTPGCRAALRYLNKFTSMEGKDFYKLIIEALYASSEKKMYNFDGYFTAYGRMKNIWLSKLAEPDIILETIDTLKGYNLAEKSIMRLKEFLPKNAVINSTFYFYVYGDIESPLMGMENGIDLFNLPRDDRDDIEYEKIINKITHWSFYDSFEEYAAEINKNIHMEEKIFLVKILAKLGIASYFFANTEESFLDNSKYYMYDYPQVWESQYNRLPELYIVADRDLQNCLKGEIKEDELESYWLKGKVSPASVLGYNMVSMINDYLGREKVIEVVKDYRKLIFYYDRASQTANLQGKNEYKFDKRLVYAIGFYTGKKL